MTVSLTRGGAGKMLAKKSKNLPSRNADSTATADKTSPLQPQRPPASRTGQGFAERLLPYPNIADLSRLNETDETPFLGRLFQCAFRLRLIVQPEEAAKQSTASRQGAKGRRENPLDSLG